MLDLRFESNTCTIKIVSNNFIWIETKWNALGTAGKIIYTACIQLPPDRGPRPGKIGDDSPKNESFSGFHHPAVNFRSHLTSLRNRTKPTRTGACRPIPTVICELLRFCRFGIRRSLAILIWLQLLGPTPIPVLADP